MKVKLEVDVPDRVIMKATERLKGGNGERVTGPLAAKMIGDVIKGALGGHLRTCCLITHGPVEVGCVVNPEAGDWLLAEAGVLTLKRVE